jgi:hypothetical protein
MPVGLSPQPSDSNSASHEQLLLFETQVANPYEFVMADQKKIVDHSGLWRGIAEKLADFQNPDTTARFKDAMVGLNQRRDAVGSIPVDESAARKLVSDLEIYIALAAREFSRCS